jgi:hypothetical protein
MNSPALDPGRPASVEIGIQCDERGGVICRADWKLGERFATDYVSPATTASVTGRTGFVLCNWGQYRRLVRHTLME